ncbi:hypothetical protein Tco_0764562, partial [Tanacetum coccineum]
VVSSFIIPVLADFADESVGSSTSLIILSDSDSEPDTESEPSEAPLSPNYVPTSSDYVPASLDYFYGSDPEFDLEESPEEDSSEDDPSGDNVSMITGLEEIPFGRPYHTYPNVATETKRVRLPLALFSTAVAANTQWITAPPSLSSDSSSEYSLTTPSYAGPFRRRYLYVSSSSPPPRKRCRILVCLSSSASLSPPLLVGLSRKRCRPPTTSLSAAAHSPAALSPMVADRLPPRRRFKGLPAASHHEETIKDTIEVVVEPVILPVHAEPADRERLDEHKEVIEGLCLLKERERTNLRERVRAMELGDQSLRDSVRTDRESYAGMQTMMTTRLGMTLDALEEQVAQHVAEALANYKANRNNENGIENDNGNGNRGDVNGNGNGNGNHNRVNGNAGGLNSRKRTIGVDAAYAMTWQELMRLMNKVYSPRNEIQKMESVLWN